MKVSYNWLKQYVDLQGVSPEELAEKLTRSGVEVEGIENRNKGVSQIFIGYVAEKAKHPDADKLNVCQVDVGQAERLQIVCGAKNVDAGQKVVVSVVGAQLPGGLKIKKAKLRGVESQGMICSAKELGMNDKLLPKDQQEGILVLPEEAEVGQDAISYLGLDDAVLELGLTPNRSDCLSMIGVAYEVAAILDREVKLPDLSLEEEGASIEDKVHVQIEAPEHCSKYAARLITGIKLGPSPFWMQSCLMAAGVRPINNIVDITNYVMLEQGQPLHAFDYDRVENGKIIVRLAHPNETIQTLDDIERKLDPDMLLITDVSKPVGIAGVMGGANSEVNVDTVSILLESAQFSGVSIRKTAKKLGLRSEASSRFEKEVNPDAVMDALNRAAQLMITLGGGKVAKGVAVETTKEWKEPTISLRLERVNGYLGTSLEVGQVQEIMRRLRFAAAESEQGLQVTVPLRRQDITREVDLIEEVARLHGYDQIPISLPEGGTTRGGLTDYQQWQRTIRNTLTSAGLFEVFTYAFSDEKVMYDFAPFEAEHKGIPLTMPMSEERSHLRVHLLPHLLETASYNQNRQNNDLSIFEMGRVFLTEEAELTKLPKEKLCLGGLLTGTWLPQQWTNKPQSVDFYDMKGILEMLFATIGAEQVVYRSAENLKGMHPGRTTEILVQNIPVGYAGQIHPELQNKYDIQEAYVFYIDLEKLFPLVKRTNDYTPLPKYPASSRDLSIVVDQAISAGDIEQTIVEAAGAILEDVHLFDVFTGEKIGAGKKSLAFSLLYRNPEATLTDQEVNEAQERVLQELTAKYQAELRM
ncbi:phenylalanine--tRNA ligase subunit beta [Ammoniphilus resinae]|uniref:Phenylalanine--tRNA ligase beta subunit n=1 Tax=Ammoniphilus resinae TaxID=861532 RepID=A0ABS4GKA0_9BACL|nr:phenylalanine--tRNA ligase subunit beta [Ammoniphilus resinae]MBP1930340.1 phenylalanyl-tRNA synthetase beta chain [Ammoniphilus resinae]